MPISANELYGDVWGSNGHGLEEELTHSLQPRQADQLFDQMLALGLEATSVLLDIGARDGRYAIELVQRSGCRAYSIDPVALHAERARQRVAEAGLQERITVIEAGIEHMPLETATASHIWCRDVLNHVALAPGLAECGRVLQPGGRMLVYQTFATPLLEPVEKARLFASMAIVTENMQPAFFEATAQAAGFRIALRDPIDSEWRERWIEDGQRQQLDDLLMLSRLRRREVDIAARYGRTVYEATLGSLTWGMYQLLGKLCPTVYILEKQP